MSFTTSASFAFAFRAVWVAVLIGLFTSLVLSTFQSPILLLAVALLESQDRFSDFSISPVPVQGIRDMIGF